jgi:prepilin-type N-terminal cleavage/methylation domain-containing protein
MKTVNARTRRIIAIRGFTLVEIMVSSLILVMVSVGAITLAMKSYEIVAKARLADNARNVLRTYGDQFLRLSIPDVSRAEFLVSSQQFEDIRANYASSFTEPLGSDTSAGSILANVNRTLTFVDLATGADIIDANTNQAGSLVRATFTVTYQFNGEDQFVSITLMRAVP